MSLEERKCKLNEIYDTLISLGVIANKTEFANIIPKNYNCLVSAMSGNERYCTEALVNKANKVLAKYLHTATELKQESPDVPAPVPAPVRVSAPLTFVDNVRPVEMKYVPTIPIKAYRAVDFDVMEYFRTTDDVIHLTPIITQFPGTDCYYFVNSDDMSPNLRTNDLLCLSRLPSPEHITNGDLCILNTRRQGMLERFVYDDGDALVLRSTQPRWTDMRIPKDDIFSIFRILGGIRTNI